MSDIWYPEEGLFLDILRCDVAYFVERSRTTFFLNFFLILKDIASEKTLEVGAFMLIFFKFPVNIPWKTLTNYI